MDLDLIYTLLISAALGLLLHKLKIVGGMMIGAMVGAVILNLSTGHAYMPYAARFIALTFSGIFIGCSIDRRDLRQLRRLWKPGLTMVISYLLLDILAGFAIWALGAGDLLTALLCCVPGGLSDVSLLAKDMGADPGQVVVFQTVRLFFGIGLFPSVIAHMKTNDVPINAPEETAELTEQKTAGPRSLKKGLLIISIAFACSTIGKLSGLPAGVMIFSMLGTMMFSIAFGKHKLPGYVRRIMQLLSGAYIGCGIGMETIESLRYMIIPVLVMLLAYLVNCIITGKILNRFFKLDMKSSMLIMTPAGVSDMALIASDMGVLGTDVVVLHVLRIITSVALFPQLDLLLANLLT